MRTGDKREHTAEDRERIMWMMREARLGKASSLSVSLLSLAIRPFPFSPPALFSLRAQGPGLRRMLRSPLALWAQRSVCQTSTVGEAKETTRHKKGQGVNYCRRREKNGERP